KEASRVTSRDGLFLVSTPNRLYYTESRAKDGPNPFHVHEFDAAEFRSALTSRFPSVTFFEQNRAESLVFSRQTAPSVRARINRIGAEDQAHFFLAVCSFNSAPELPAFVYVPRASNILREREQHIRLLEEELAQTKDWLASTIADQQKLMAAHKDQAE